jgi:adhesin transport system outer membrane protein
MARLQHENAIANYKSLLPEITSLEQFQTPSLKKLPAESLEDLVELAKQNYPLLHSTRSTVTAIKAEANRAKAAFYPTVDIVAQAYWNDKVHGVGYDNPLVPGTPGSKETEDAGYNALLVVNYNLFKGGSDSAFEQTKQHKLLKEQSKYLDQERSVVEGLTLSRNNFNLTTNSLQHIESYMNATGETKANYEKEHELGRRSIIDLLNISVEFNNARNRKVSAEYDRLIAYYEVLAYTGKLFEEMSISFE